MVQEVSMPAYKPESIFVKICKQQNSYFVSIYNGDNVLLCRPFIAALSPQNTVRIKNEYYALETILEKLYKFDIDTIESLFDERGQYQLGNYLYRQVLGRQTSLFQRIKLLDKNHVDLTILSDDEHIHRLPWVLLCTDNTNFLTRQGWSISISTEIRQIECSLSADSSLLIFAPNPTNFPDTGSTMHIADVQKLLEKTGGKSPRVTIVSSWEQLLKTLKKSHFQTFYYYGHGIADKHKTRLLVANDQELPISDLADAFNNMPGGPPVLAYINCCKGHEGGKVGVSSLLAVGIPAVLSNITLVKISVAQKQAKAFWQALFGGAQTPEQIVHAIRQRSVSIGLSNKDIDWFNLLYMKNYETWLPTMCSERSYAALPKGWKYRLNRQEQFKRVVDILNEKIAAESSFIDAVHWRSSKENGLYEFSERLKLDLTSLAGDKLKVIIKKSESWPKITANFAIPPFIEMLEKTFSVINYQAIPSELSSGIVEKDSSTLMVLLHQIQYPMDARSLRGYLHWWRSSLFPALKKKRISVLLAFAIPVDPEDEQLSFNRTLSPLDRVISLSNRLLKRLTNTSQLTAEHTESTAQELKRFELINDKQIFEFIVENKVFSKESFDSDKQLKEDIGGVIQEILTATNGMYQHTIVEMESFEEKVYQRMVE